VHYSPVLENHQKHANRIIDAHRLTENYMDYGDTSAYREKLAELRKAVASENA